MVAFARLYDANGNRTNTGDTTGADNLLTSDGTFNYAYDADGNCVGKPRISNAPANDYTTLYTWDYRNRLTSVTTENNSGQVTQQVRYAYDYANPYTRAGGELLEYLGKRYAGVHSVCPYGSFYGAGAKLGAACFKHGFNPSKQYSISAMASSVSFSSEQLGDEGIVLSRP